VPHGEIIEDGLAIIADRSQPESLFLKSLFSVLQLHELRFAKGSPIGGAEEKKHRAIRPLQRLDGLLMTKLIARCKGRCILSHLQADRG